MKGKPTCYHCGEACVEEEIQAYDKKFCCVGCKLVYEILAENGLQNYYTLEQQPGIRKNRNKTGDFTYLEDPDVWDQLVDFDDGTNVKITFRVPQIHCSSCLWLLENLYRLNGSIVQSRVNFLSKRVTISFLKSQMTLRQLVELLHSIGYEPEINLAQNKEAKVQKSDRHLYYKLGLAGFVFGNVMLFSFPEYLGMDNPTFQKGFGYLNLILSLPILFYCASDYWRSAWLALRRGSVNIDLPITLGILTLFGRSAYEIIFQVGAGYLDSLAGLVFFLLIGRWFQRVTYLNLDFERDYQSYFPIAVTKKEGHEWRSMLLNKVRVGDELRIRDEELVPVDGIISRGQAVLDYSFVTGENDLVHRSVGDRVFAGGKQKGKSIEIRVSREVSNSYLTQLWQDSAFLKDRTDRRVELSDRFGKYFTFAVLLIAFSTLFYWWVVQPSVAINAFTAVLIIACPCAIALAIPFTYGNALRLLAGQHFYLRDISVIEAMQNLQLLLFDKTGTLMQAGGDEIEFYGDQLGESVKSEIKTLCEQSGHPLSRRIAALYATYPSQEVEDYREVTGQGIEGNLNGHHLKLGSAGFMGLAEDSKSSVYVNYDGEIQGAFRIKGRLRPGLDRTLPVLAQRYELSLLSGDNERERHLLAPYFKDPKLMRFNQHPDDKLQFVKAQQATGKKVMMIGDGLNDAGALRQSEVGIVVSDDTNNFTPASDAILSAPQLHKMNLYLTFIKQCKQVIWVTYGLALLYNIVGLSFAVTGTLSPIVAAILMPLSSVTVVLTGVALTSLLANKIRGG